MTFPELAVIGEFTLPLLGPAPCTTEPSEVVGSVTCWDVPALVMKEVVLFNLLEVDRLEFDGIETRLSEMMLIELR
jgi:hypothetical protein